MAGNKRPDDEDEPPKKGKPEQDAFGAAAARKGKLRKEKQPASSLTHRMSLWGTFYGGVVLGVHNHPLGGYLTISPYKWEKGAPQFDDKQIKAAIMNLALTKGCDEIYFYKDRNIDKELTSRASVILADMKAAGVIPPNHPVRIMTEKMRHKEPFVLFEPLRPVKELFRSWKENRETSKDARQSRKLLNRYLN